MSDKNALWARVVNIICGDESPSYNHGAKADLIFMVVEKPLHARIAELEAALKPFADANQFIIMFGVQWVKATEDDFRAARAALKGEK